MSQSQFLFRKRRRTFRRAGGALFSGLTAFFTLAVPFSAQAQVPFEKFRARLGPTREAAALRERDLPRPTNQILVKFKKGVSQPPLQFAKQFSARQLVAAPLNAPPAAVPTALTFLRSIDKSGWHVFRMPTPDSLRSTLAALRQCTEVAVAEPDQRLKLLIAPPTNPKWNLRNEELLFPSFVNAATGGLFTDPDRYYDSSSWVYNWHLNAVNAQNAWGEYPGHYPGASERINTDPSHKPLIAVIDTGLDMGHPAFGYNGPDSTDAVFGGHIATGLARNFQDGSDDPDPMLAMDGFGHGTSVAGVIAAGPNNGMGIPGLGFPARIVPIRIYGENGEGTDSDLIRAIRYAADSGCVVANVSARTDSGYSPALQDAIDYAWNKGMLLVAAIGNDGDVTNASAGLIRRYPASMDRVLAVGATTAGGDAPGGSYEINGENVPYSGPYYLDEGLASYSNYGNNAGVVAPAGDVTDFDNFAPGQTDEFWDAIMLQYSFPPPSGIGLPYPGAVPEIVFTYTTAPTYEVPLSDPTNSAFGSYAAYGLYKLNYGFIPGTSFACPMVVGLASLYAAKFGLVQAPGVPQRILSAIERGCDSFNARADGGFDQVYGWGRINAYATLRELNNRNATVGGVVGIIKDNETVLANQNVTVKKNGVVQSSLTGKTEADGVFHIYNIPAGTYEISTNIGGKIIKRDVTVTPGCDTHAQDLIRIDVPILVTIQPVNALIAYGTTKQYIATVTGADDPTVIFDLPTPAGANVDGETGLLTAPLAPGASNLAIIRATSLQDPARYASTTVKFVPRLTKLTLSKNTVNGGTSVTGTVTMSHPAPSGGTVIALKSSTPRAVVPATLTIAAGQTSKNFTITTNNGQGGSDPSEVYATISATYANIQLAEVLAINQAGATVNGTILLDSIVPGASSQFINIEFRPTDNSAKILKSAQITPDGAFSVFGLPRKTYTLWAKGAKWLANTVTVNATGGLVNGVSLTLPGGDANNSNNVNFDDFTILADHYFTTEGIDDLYDTRADFNCDGEVNFDDFLILASHYFENGAP